MSWLGKVVGGAFGFMMGGPLGAALGATLGHQFDRNGFEFRLETNGFGSDDAQRLQMTFFSATFQIMGHIAKADGRVTEAEIEAARTVMARMTLSDDLRRYAMRFFREGKEDDFPFDTVVDQLHSACRGRAYLIRMFITLQTEAALADGRIQPVEETLLLRLCDRLHFSRYEYFGIRTRLETERRFTGFGPRQQQESPRYRQYRWQYEPPTPSQETSLADAYATLGLTPSATDSEVKKAYRRRVSQHHPDKLAGREVSAQRMQQATEQTQKIQRAYDAICKARHL